MSKVRDFNLLKVADISSNSSNTNSVSVVVNTDNAVRTEGYTSGKVQDSNQMPNQNVNFTPTPTLPACATPMPQSPIFPVPNLQPQPGEVEYPSTSNQQ